MLLPCKVSQNMGEEWFEHPGAAGSATCAPLPSHSALQRHTDTQPLQTTTSQHQMISLIINNAQLSRGSVCSARLGAVPPACLRAQANVVIMATGCLAASIALQTHERPVCRTTSTPSAAPHSGKPAGFPSAARRVHGERKVLARLLLWLTPRRRSPRVQWMGRAGVKVSGAEEAACEPSVRYKSKVVTFQRSNF